MTDNPVTSHQALSPIRLQIERRVLRHRKPRKKKYTKPQLQHYSPASHPIRSHL